MSEILSEYHFDSLNKFASTLQKSDWSSVTIEIAKNYLQQLNTYFEQVHADAETFGVNQKLLDEAKRIYNTCKNIILSHITTMSRRSPPFLGFDIEEETDFPPPPGAVGSFSGDYIAWCDFFSRFVEHVHNNRMISNSEKLRRLLATVTGKAARVLGNWAIRDENYMKAFNKLRAVYSNKYLVGSRIIEAMANRPPIDSTFDSLQSLIEEIEELERNFATIGMPPDHWDRLIVFVVEKRLDDRSREGWMGIRHGDPNGMPSLADMMSFLRGRALALPSTSDGARMQWSGFPRFGRMSPPVEPKTEGRQQKAAAKKAMKNSECYICHREVHEDRTECKDCPALAHFKCLKGAEVVKNKKESRNWKCNKCLRCGICHSTNRVVSLTSNRMKFLPFLLH